MPESKKRSLKSVAVGPTKIVRTGNKCNQQWKHPKTLEE